MQTTGALLHGADAPGLETLHSNDNDCMLQHLSDLALAIPDNIALECQRYVNFADGFTSSSSNRKTFLRLKNRSAFWAIAEPFRPLAALPLSITIRDACPFSPRAFVTDFVFESGRFGMVNALFGVKAARALAGLCGDCSEQDLRKRADCSVVVARRVCSEYCRRIDVSYSSQGVFERRA